MNSMQEFGAWLLEQTEQLDLRFEEPLSEHTSFKIGGPAALMAFPKDAQQLRRLLQLSHQRGVKPIVLGAGTNVLAPDEGIDGFLICTRGCLSGMKQLSQTQLEVYSGQTLAKAAMFARDCGLSGLEFAHGIPGTVGGGLYMNAGAYGGELCQVTEQTAVLLPDGTETVFTGTEQGFDYRKSVFSTMDCVIVKTIFSLKPAGKQEIRSRMQELASKRLASQPLELPSAGSAFKRPAGGYAAALIEQAGLKGFRIGGAQVSEKHSGFIVNTGGATCRDVLALIEEVQHRVQARSGMVLEPEIRLLARR